MHRTKPNQHKELGFGLLGVLFLIASSVTLISLLTGGIYYLAKEQRSLEQLHYVQEVRGTLQLILDQYARLPLEGLLIIHRNGQIYLADSSLHQLSQREDRLALLKGSSALTSVRTAFPCVLSIVDTSQETRICPVSCQDTGQPRSLLGVSVEGLFEFESAHYSDSQCSQVRLASSLGFFSAQTWKSQEEPLSILIPILETRTLYIDRSGCLRFVQTVGSEVIENQPVACISSVDSFSLNLRQEDSARIIDISLSFEGRAYHSHVIQAVASHSRSELILAAYE